MPDKRYQHKAIHHCTQSYFYHNPLVAEVTFPLTLYFSSNIDPYTFCAIEKAQHDPQEPWFFTELTAPLEVQFQTSGVVDFGT